MTIKVGDSGRIFEKYTDQTGTSFKWLFAQVIEVHGGGLTVETVSGNFFVHESEFER